MKKAIVILGLLILIFFINGCTATGKTVNDVDYGYVKIPYSSLSGKVQFYTYENEGVKINYFAVLGNDGKARTAFDACDVCGGFRVYEQIGNDIRCRNCGRVFSINGLGTQNKGYGCWPSYLPHEVKDENILIKESDIIKGKGRFILN